MAAGDSERFPTFRSRDGIRVSCSLTLRCWVMLADSGYYRCYKGTLILRSIYFHDRQWLAQAILNHLVAPRIGMGPEEAYFCSKFFNTLHAIEAPNFNRCAKRHPLHRTFLRPVAPPPPPLPVERHYLQSFAWCSGSGGRWLIGRGVL